MAISLIVFQSCNNDDDNVIQENSNGFLLNSEFVKINNAYYTNDFATERNDDFIIIVTDGEVISFSSESNELLFSNETTNAVLFNGIQNPNTPNALNFIPSGSYTLNSSNESIGYVYFDFNCENTGGTLQLCEYSQLVDENDNANLAVIDIERDDSTAYYELNFDFELSNSIMINGQFSGFLESLQ